MQAERIKDGKWRARNIGKWKILKTRPVALQPSTSRRKHQLGEEEESDDESYISVKVDPAEQQPVPPAAQEVRAPLAVQGVMPEAREPIDIPHIPQPPPEPRRAPQTTPANRPKRNPKPIERLGCAPPVGPSGSRTTRQLSPRERERRKGLARRRARTNSKESWVMEPGSWTRTSTGWRKREGQEGTEEEAMF